MAVPRSFVDPSVGDPPSRTESGGSTRTDPDDPDDAVGTRWASDPIAGMRPMPPQSMTERFHDWADRLRSPAETNARSMPHIGRWIGPAVAIAIVGIAGWWFLKPPPAPVESRVPLAGATPDSAGSGGQAQSVEATGASTASGAGSGGAGAIEGPGGPATTVPVELVVQASGAVVHPGVYRLPADARVDDVVRSAGGLAPEADGDRVNLAAPLLDGERVWIPRRGELTAPVVVAGAAGGGGARAGGAGGATDKGGGTTSATPAVVDLNSATATELEALPGVGPATATAIVSYREEHGRFTSVDDLLEVRGIGDAKLEQIRPLARV